MISGRSAGICYVRRNWWSCFSGHSARIVLFIESVYQVDSLLGSVAIDILSRDKKIPLYANREKNMKKFRIKYMHFLFIHKVFLVQFY